MITSYVVVVPWEGGACTPWKQLRIEQQLRYGLVVRIPGSHPGGPGSIPGNGKLLFWDSLKVTFWIITCRLGSQKEGEKNIASAGNRTRINCLEGSYADHYTTEIVGKRFWPRPDSNTQPSDLESDALPLRHGVKLCEVLSRFELGSLDSKSRVLTITP